MQLARFASATHPRHFGRGPRKELSASADRASHDDGSFWDDVRLFTTTFLAGFIFVSVLIG